VVIGVGGTVFQLVVNTTVQESVEKATIEVTAIKVLDTEGSVLSLRLTGVGTDDNILSSLIDGYTIDILLPGISALDIMSISLVITNASSNTLSLNISINIDNPSATDVLVSDLIFETSYGGYVLGNITIPSLTVFSGNHTYDLDVTSNTL
jgi:hypothetical protein